jgi:nicotinate dehydrogenase subunit A
MSVRLTVNGVEHSIDSADSGTPLLYVLRNDLGLNGPKFGCGLEQCGACAVLVGGEAVPSCRRTVGSIGSPVTTLEGLGSADALDPLQTALIDEQAAQCAYCMNGVVMFARALLNRCPHPSEATIRDALAPVLCRCGCHNRILRAVERAAKASA